MTVVFSSTRSFSSAWMRTSFSFTISFNPWIAASAGHLHRCADVAVVFAQTECSFKVLSHWAKVTHFGWLRYEIPFGNWQRG